MVGFPHTQSFSALKKRAQNPVTAQSTRLSYGLVLDLNHFRTAYYYDELTKTAPTTIFAFKEQAFQAFFSVGRKTIVIGAVLGAENDGWQYFFGLDIIGDDL